MRFLFPLLLLGACGVNPPAPVVPPTTPFAGTDINLQQAIQAVPGASSTRTFCRGHFSEVNREGIVFATGGGTEPIHFYGATPGSPPLIQELETHPATDNPLELQCLKPAEVEERNRLLTQSEGIVGHIEASEYDLVCLNDPETPPVFHCYSFKGGAWVRAGGWST